jgi:PIN domain nuclease of toxin-antitoxin system
MKHLIDTQIIIWILEDSQKLTPKIREILGDKSNTFLLSKISLLEIGIKLKLGKLPDFIVSMEEFIEKINQSGVKILQIEDKHIATYQIIPLMEDHRDPFDRYILATTLSENIPIISADEKFKMYVPLINLIEA